MINNKPSYCFINLWTCPRISDPEIGHGCSLLTREDGLLLKHLSCFDAYYWRTRKFALSERTKQRYLPNVGLFLLVNLFRRCSRRGGRGGGRERKSGTFLSLFLAPSPSPSPNTPDTQAIYTSNLVVSLLNID